MLDAVHVGLQEMKRAKNPRKALLMISDGGDNNSRYSAKQIEDLVREADVQIYAMGVFEPVFSFGPTTAGLTAAEMSGPSFCPKSQTRPAAARWPQAVCVTCPESPDGSASELRNQYVLAYTPTNHNRDGKYRKVQVKVDQPKALPALKPRWRLGYYAPND